MNMCFNCGYCWKEDGEPYARCHFDGPEGWAPCECEDGEPVEDYPEDYMED